MTTRILITGAGGPAALGVLQHLQLPHVAFHVGDMSPGAAGMFLVPLRRRAVLLPGEHEQFVDHLLSECVKRKVHVLWPTVDVELERIAAERFRFENAGIKVVLPSLRALSATLDKWKLHQACHGKIPLPDTRLWAPALRARLGEGRFILKPRRGSGSRGIYAIGPEKTPPPGLENYLIQEELPGEEFSVDTFVSRDRKAQVAVPRLRAHVDSGVAVLSQTVRDESLQRLALDTMATLCLTGVANVQFRRDRFGHPRLLEVNPRVAGTMVLSVCAGIDLFKLALSDTLGLPLSAPKNFKELAVVRRLTEQYIRPDELDSMRELHRRNNSRFARLPLKEGAA